MVTYMTHRACSELSELLDGICDRTPDYHELELDGVKHSLWRVDDPARMDRIKELLGRLDHLYIADGHHRSAAACGGQGMEAGRRFLAAMFPHDQLRILDYNRVVQDLGGLSIGDFISRISEIFDVRPVERPWQPDAKGRFGMYIGGNWYALTVRAETLQDFAAIDCLDVSLLARLVLEPLLGISDVRRDPRIDFVGGSRGLQALEARVDGDTMAVAFSLFPTASPL